MRLGQGLIVPNVTYTLDYTKTSYSDPGVVCTIPIPSGRWRIISLGWLTTTSANSNFVVKVHIGNSPFMYPNNTSEYNAPPTAYQLIGVVPTDYKDVEGGNNIVIYSVMTGSATANTTFNLTLNMKQILEGNE